MTSKSLESSHMRIAPWFHFDVQGGQFESRSRTLISSSAHGSVPLHLHDLRPITGSPRGLSAIYTLMKNLKVGSLKNED